MMLSNSFAFGGTNADLVLQRAGFIGNALSDWVRLRTELSLAMAIQCRMRWRLVVGSLFGPRSGPRSASAAGCGTFISGQALDASVTSVPFDTQSHLQGKRTASALQVLVVDDAPGNLQHAVRLLSHFGIVPTTACNGADALALARRRHFDLILMDICMPVMDGMEATRQIRLEEMNRVGRPRAKIVAYTSGKVLADMAVLVRIGFDEAMQKPGNVSQMDGCLGRVAARGVSPRPGPG